MEKENYEILWEQTFLPELEKTVSSLAYETYVKQITPVDLKGNKIIFCTKSRLFADTVTANNNAGIGSKIREVLVKNSDYITDFEVVVADNREEYLKQLGDAEREAITDGGSPINPKFTFDSFVVGSSNEFIYAAAKAVAESLGAEEIVIVSRSGEVNYKNVYELHGDADFIINTTPVGMYPDSDGRVIDLDSFSSLSGVTDVVYNPLKTRLCLLAEDRGIRNINGLYMLVYQAVLACSLFTGKELATEELCDEIYDELLKEKQNIVLIGMPGSGKSTLGKALAERLCTDFTDTDEIISARYGNIADIFAGKGEKYFREAETQVIKEVSMLNGKVIATGGGAVLRKENVDALRQNGRLFFLNRPLEDIIPTDDRPLSSDYEALKKRFEERYDIYTSSADKEIYVDGNIDNAVGRILESL